MVYIYALYPPGDIHPRYIGKANNPQRRLASHIRDSVRRQTPVACWIRNLVAQGKKPDLVVLREVPAAEWQKHERDLIAAYRANGADLLNLAEGGDQPHQTPEQRADAGRAAVRARERSPRAKRLWAYRRSVGQHLQWLAERGMFDATYRLRFKVRAFAAAIPELRSWAATV